MEKLKKGRGYTGRSRSRKSPGTEEPPEYLVNLLKNKKVKVGLALDVCAGAGANAVYLAREGFDVTGELNPQKVH